MSTSPTPSSTASSSGPRAAHLRAWPAPARLTTPLLALGLLVLAVVAAFVGPYPISLADALRAVLNRLSGEIPPTAATLDTVLFFVRLPRVAAAMLVGGALAAAGAAYQGLFRNPLVSPDILGVSAGAGLGAVLGIFLSLPVVGIQLLAFLVGLGTVGLVLLIAASVRGREPVLVLVLAGVVVGALAGSAISLLKVLADPYDQLPAITFWLLGSLAAIKLEDLTTTVPVAALGLVPLALLRWRINVLSLGDEEARALGINAGAPAHRGDRGRDADDRERGRDRRHHRLGRADHAAHGAHARRPQLRPAAARRDDPRRRLPFAGRHAGAHASPRSRPRSASSPRSSARRCSCGCSRAAGTGWA